MLRGSRAIWATLSRTSPVCSSTMRCHASSTAGTPEAVNCPPIQSVGSSGAYAGPLVGSGKRRGERRRRSTTDDDVVVQFACNRRSRRVGSGGHAGAKLRDEEQAGPTFDWRPHWAQGARSIEIQHDVLAGRTRVTTPRDIIAGDGCFRV